MRFHVPLLILLATLTSCATTHPENVKSPDTILTPAGKAKIVITRNNDFLFMGVKARLDVNGQRVSELWRKDSYSAVLEPGKVTLETDAWSTAGNFRAHFNAEADREYIFEVSPRGGHMATLTFFGIVGAAVDATIDENTGPFSINLIETRTLQ